MASLTQVLSGDQQKYLEDLYKIYQTDPSALSNSWRDFFKSLESGANGTHSSSSFMPFPKISRSDVGVIEDIDVKALLMVQAYRRHGHFAAHIDPLDIDKPERGYLDLDRFGLTEQDMSRKATITIGGKEVTDTLENIRDRMEAIYCSTMGSEFFYIRDEEHRQWIIERLEADSYRADLSDDEKELIYHKLYSAEAFERYIATHYPGKKRFSLEGGEALIPGIATAIEVCGEYNIKQVVIGMAHRGRLNVLANVMGKDPAQIFAEFNENISEDIDSGDVKYHLGYSSDYETLNGSTVHLSLAFNPSHLEVINPVVLGSIRARQKRADDTDRREHMPLIIHGDAAFTGQGINYECLNMSKLNGYSTGGALHIICNNQIGFTTDPQDGRSTPYATDLAKMLQVPIFHVNGDDPDAVYKAVKLALEWRQTYQTDVFIDLICYRRLGHNETDEPSFTQPSMYAKIKKHPTAVKQYEKKLKNSGFEQSRIENARNKVNNHLEDAYERTASGKLRSYIETLSGSWKGFRKYDMSSRPDTAISKSLLEKITNAITEAPEGFNVNRKVQRLLDDRRKMIFEDNGKIDWGMAEALAYGSLLVEQSPIRLTGQDVKRGTFSHRHAVLFDTETSKPHTLLNHIEEGQAELEIQNSLLSEVAALGFEFGYSLADPNSLVIWEAQFGDFVNGAQVIIDQFISSSETKWNRHSGIVLLLPHGYEGQGPEHSSARLERFLQLCSQFNVQVCNATTPAQFFHLLRRQMKRNFRKPLIVMTPKSLLRHPVAVNSVSDFTSGTFEEVLDDPAAKTEPKKIKRLRFCSGKIYYDLLDAKKKNKVDDVAIIRVEQLYPFPNENIKALLDQYPDAKDVAWVQEEPRNQGAWIYMEHLLGHLCPARLNYYGRLPSPSPATGYFKVHKKEQLSIIQEALDITLEEE